MKNRPEAAPPRLTADQIRQLLAAEKTGQNPDCFSCGTPVTAVKATVHYGKEEEIRVATVWPCGHGWSYNVRVAEKVEAQMRMEAATQATEPGTPLPLDTAENGAWNQVWLEGNWRWITSRMTTEQREYAADRVAAYGRYLGFVDGERGRGEPEGLRWWREDR
jgi:hypothetical protein